METKTERKPRDYKNGKIYCIRNHINDEIYVGSTCQSLSKRMAYHRQDCMKSNRYNTLIYKMMSDLGRDNFYIELIEEYPCENSNQLERREGELMRELKASLNQKIAGRTIEEYKIDNYEKIKKTKAISDKKYAEKNQEKLKAYRKEYYDKNPEKFKEDAKRYAEENREKIRERDKLYYQKNRDETSKKGKEYRDNNVEKLKARRKAYYEKNRDKILEKNKEYRIDNKDKLKIQQQKYCEENREKKSEYDKMYREKKKLQKSQSSIEDLD